MKKNQSKYFTPTRVFPSFIMGIFTAILVLFLTSCSSDDDGGDGGNNGGDTQTEQSLLNAALYGISYAVEVSVQYNDKKLSPTSIGDIARIYYQPNGALDYMTVDLNTLSKPPLKKTIIIPFLYGRPGAMAFTGSADTANDAARVLVRGEYNYSDNPADILGYFGGYLGSGKFVSLENLRVIANNPAISEELYNSMTFVNNCHKVIVFGKNKSNRLIGKYVGYVYNNTYTYWCIDEEDTNFEKKLSVTLPQ